VKRSGRIRSAFAVLAASIVLATAEAESQFTRRVPRGLDWFMSVPDENVLTEGKVRLGARLFGERRLSGDGTIACSSCHDRTMAFADGRAVSIGIEGRRGMRSSPTLVNRGYGRTFFWDGRTATLEEQVLGPIENPNEMGSQLSQVVQQLRSDRDYAGDFRSLFNEPVSANRIAHVLASYLRTITSGDAPFDRFAEGEREALSLAAQRGLSIFRGRGRCSSCHVAPTFSDEAFHNTGVAWNGRALVDEGRGAITGLEIDRGAFKTPTLREIARTAPYMHDGSVATLHEVIDFYAAGGRPNPWLDPEIRPLHLSAQDKTDLVELLRSLSGSVADGSP
jgi:cytochrome c peroxidase